MQDLREPPDSQDSVEVPDQWDLLVAQEPPASPDGLVQQVPAVQQEPLVLPVKQILLFAYSLHIDAHKVEIHGRRSL